MGDVIPFGPEVADNEPPPTGVWWRRGSRALAHVVFLLACCLGAFTAGVLVLGLACGGAFLSMGADAAYLGPAPDLPGVVPFGALPPPTRAAYAVTLVLDTAPVLVVLAELRVLLHLYAAGHAFGPRHGSRVRRIAAGLAATAAAPLLGRALVLLAGHGVDVAWFHASAVEALVLAAALWLVAAAMDAGHAAEVDRGGFV